MPQDTLYACQDSPLHLRQKNPKPLYPYQQIHGVLVKRAIYLSQKSPTSTPEDALYPCLNSPLNLRQKSPLYLHQQTHGVFVQRVMYFSQKRRVSLAKETCIYARRHSTSISK